MRIAVIGPQNVGKTTFIKDFLESYKNYQTLHVSYRDLIEQENLVINQQTNEKSQAIIMNFLYDLITKNIEENIIYDRCVIDNYAYSMAGFLKGNVDVVFLKINKQKMLEHLDFLDTIFFIPASLLVDLEDDKFRDIDKNFIDLVNRIFIETLLEISKIKNIPIHVLSGSRNERLVQISEIINK